VLGIGLLAFAAPISSSLKGMMGYETHMTLPPVRPSPTWAPMPTRAHRVQIIPVDTSGPLEDLRLALLRREFETAEFIWAQSPVPAPPDQAAWYRNGARLFLALGQTDRAEALAWNAIVLSSIEPNGWLVLHLVLRERQDWRTAEYALETALHLEPLRTGDLFWDRWLLAVENEDVGSMTSLAESFRLRNPDDSLGAYLNARALLAVGEASEAAAQLVEALQQDPNAPVVLWYTLGEAYLELDAHEEALSVLETVARRLYTDDAAMIHLEAPFLETLNFRLAQAYLGTGACANAEAVFRRLVASGPDAEREASRFDAWIEQAIRCQTPTPTLTPWIPDQYAPLPSQD